jgi:snurportin-1
MDIMCWAGYQLYDCKSEFRMYWLHSKMQELPQQGKCGEKSFCFTPVPFHQCNTGTRTVPMLTLADEAFLSVRLQCHTYTANMSLLAGGLQSALAAPVGFRRDGLLFLHREGHYDLGTSPLGLLWKDASSSRYFIETDAKGNILAQQAVVLRCLRTGQIGTGDEPPCPLGPMPVSLARADSGHLE